MDATTTDQEKATKLRRLAEKTLDRYGECLRFFHAGSSCLALGRMLDNLQTHHPEAREEGDAAEYLQGLCGFDGQVYLMELRQHLESIELVVVNSMQPIKFLGRQFATAFEAAALPSEVLCDCARGGFSAASSSEERYKQATAVVYSLLSDSELTEDLCNELQNDYQHAVEAIKVRIAQEWQLWIAQLGDPADPMLPLAPKASGEVLYFNGRQWDGLPSAAIDLITKLWDSPGHFVGVTADIPKARTRALEKLPPEVQELIEVAGGYRWNPHLVRFE